ncbi:MAG: type IV pilin protein [Burkholderiaceae bacterium]
MPSARPIISAPCRSRRSRGFTLIETMVATAISAILSSIAYPSFQAQVNKARRADAMLAIHQVQMAQERWRANHATYATLTQLGFAATSPSGHYTVAVAAVASHGYEITASATGPQARDTDCRQIGIAVEGANALYRSGSDAAMANGASLNRSCWSL